VGLSPNVFGLVHKLKVQRIAATAIAAHMIDLELARDEAVEMNV
jgi:hypothetical protein